jgi:hypothetical protein
MLLGEVSREGIERTWKGRMFTSKADLTVFFAGKRIGGRYETKGEGDTRNR